MPAGRQTPIPAVKRVEGFAKFFRSYARAMTLIVAAIPIPITVLHVLPTFRFQTTTIAFLTPMICYLCLSLIYFNRHHWAHILFEHYFDAIDTRPEQKIDITKRLRRMIGIQHLPLLIIIFTCLFLFQYYTTLNDDAYTALSNYVTGCNRDFVDIDCVLNNASYAQVPNSWILILYYSIIFVTAELAFIIMALKEWLQDVIGLTDTDLIFGDRFKPKERSVVNALEQPKGQDNP